MFVQHFGMKSSKWARSGFTTVSLRWVTKHFARDTWSSAVFISELQKSNIHPACCLLSRFQGLTTKQCLCVMFIWWSLISSAIPLDMGISLLEERACFDWGVTWLIAPFKSRESVPSNPVACQLWGSALWNSRNGKFPHSLCKLELLGWAARTTQQLSELDTEHSPGWEINLLHLSCVFEYQTTLSLTTMCYSW